MPDKFFPPRATTAVRNTITLDLNEILLDTDLQRFYVGDGSTAGGVVLGSGSGEANTASNGGTGGIGLTLAKSGVDLPFKSIFGSTGITVADGGGNNRVEISANAAAIDHDSLQNFVANEHIDHSAVSISAGTGLSGGGTIAANRTLNLSHLGIESLADPNADRIAFWDDSAGAFAWLTPGTNLSITGTTLDAAAGSGEANTSSNSGAGEGLALAKSGVDLPFKSILDGTGITITSQATTITIGFNHLGLGSLSDPGADRIYFFDTSSGNSQFLEVGSGLSITGTTLTASGGGGLADVVDDTTPQLGGNLDANSFNLDFDNNTGIRDSNGNEQLLFALAASAVNHLQVQNAATGSNPSLSAIGSDTNISLRLLAKGTGEIDALANLDLNSNSILNASISAALIDSGTLPIARIADGSVTDAKLENMAAWTIKLRNAASAGVPADVKISALTTEASPTTGDFLLMEESGGALRKVDWSSLPGSGGGISNIVEDITPQLGGMLDVNGQAIGDGTRELLTFVEDVSAVNHLEIENNAAASDPILRAVGDDTNVGLEFQTKGTGVFTFSGGISTFLTTLDSNDRFVMYEATAGIIGGFTPANVAGIIEGSIDHDVLTNFVADEHVAHSGVTLTAGAGLTGGGTIAASRSFAVGAGTGITVNADDIQISDGGVGTTQLANNGVTLAKLATMATDSFLGRDTAGTGNVEVLSAATARSVLNVADGANNYSHPNHTGDVTSTGDGATTIANGAVTLAKMANMATDSLLGRDTAGSGVPEVLSASAVRTILNVADGANNYSHPNHTGDVTSTGDGATVIADEAVTLAKMAHMATASLLGRNTAATGDVEVLGVATVEGMLNHDNLAGFVANEHLDWSATGAEDIHVDRFGELVQSRGITIIDPTASDDASIFFTTRAITVSEVRSHITGTTNVVFNIQHASTRTGTGLNVFTSNITLTSTAGQQNNSGFNDNTIPANSWVWLNVVSVSGTPTRFHATVVFSED